MRTFHDRYKAGEHEPVWDELCALGAQVRDPLYYPDAVAVARETMLRVRLNCEMLIPRLENLGWQFGYAWAGPWAADEIQEQPPRLGEPAPATRLDAIEAHNGPLPLALRAFYEIVGAINFVGTPFQRPNWPGIQDGLDPLYIAGVEQAFGPDNLPVGPDWWPKEALIAPDFLHKYFISGVGSLYIEIPSSEVDAPLMFEDGPIQLEDRNVPLVRYLRYAMRGGGFLAFMPGWEPEEMPKADLAYLTEGLWPI